MLAARIGQILLETDALPENILCLTFTDAGVIAMRNRLLQFIGPAAHRVHLFTFHAFCNHVIQSNLALFGRQDMEPLGDLERVDLIRRLIDQLQPGHPLYRSQVSPYFYEGHLARLFQLMNKENWTRERVLERIDTWLRSLPEHPDFVYKVNTSRGPKGTVREARVRQEQERMDRLRAAVALYPLYEQEKRRAGRYDYDDMILWVWKAFATHPFLLRNYQERYQFVLVDEYQDTNSAQNDILLQLISYWDNPNVFIVGDDDQSIYEFQGARLQNLTDFIVRYEASLEVVTLQENYRSTQPILDAAAALVQNNTLRIGGRSGLFSFEKRLHAANPRHEGARQFPFLSEYASRLHETAHILQQIEDMLAQNVRPSEIAVIYAQHRQSRDLLLLFQKKGIPYLSKRSINILETPLMQQLLQLLEYLHREQTEAHSAERLLFRILHFRYWGLSPRYLAAMSLSLSDESGEKGSSWRETLHDPQKVVPAMPDSSADAFRQVAAALEELIAAEGNLLLPELVELAINRSGLLYYVLQSGDKQESIQILHAFLQFVRGENERNPWLRLPDLLSILNRMQENRVPLPLNQTIGEEGGVQFLTAHSAKGLEFDRVFLIDAVKDYWEPRNQSANGQFPLPGNLLQSGEEDALEARRRLFYVAMTRAKSFLHISFAKTDEKQKELARTRFIDELQEGCPKMAIQEPPVAKDSVLQTQIDLLQLAQAPVILAQEQTFVEERLARFNLSVSSLNAFLNCPLGFYFEYILQVPALSSEQAVYGTAMHVAMQKLFAGIQPAKAFPPETDFLQFFEREMLRKKGRFYAQSFDKYLSQGKHYLRGLYAQQVEEGHKEVHVEYTIRKVEIDGVPVTGTIDKIEYHPGLSVGIIDYKTGRVDEGGLSRPSDKKPGGGIYWRQLSFYKLLFENLDRSSRQ
ncbi:MAG: ATP-dependent helicase, partial [Haliscomenobacter sp.]